MRTATDKVIRIIRRNIFGHSAAINEMPFCEVRPKIRDPHDRGGEDVKSRVLVISQPKAGTYMIAEILRQAGFHNTHLHLAPHRLQAYDRFYLEEGISSRQKFDVECGIDESRKLIRLGELAVSHLPFSNDLAEKLSGFQIIHVKRELRSAFVSWSRMLLYTERNGKKVSDIIRTENIAGFMRIRGKKAIRHALSINAWSCCSNVLSLKKERISSNPTKSIDTMMHHVDCKSSLSATEIWELSTGKETLTNSIKYPDLEWTDRDEEVFRDIGGPDANRQLGYEEEGD